MEWNGMEWNGMEWNGMEWNGIVMFTYTQLEPPCSQAFSVNTAPYNGGRVNGGLVD